MDRPVIVGIDQKVDPRVLRKLQRDGSIELRQAHELVQTWATYVGQLRMLHTYAAYLNGNDYFVTENVKDFIRDDRPEKLEELLRLRVRTTSELAVELGS